MNQMDDAVFHRNIGTYDFSHNNTCGMFCIADNCIRFDVSCNEITFWMKIKSPNSIVDRSLVMIGISNRSMKCGDVPSSSIDVRPKLDKPLLFAFLPSPWVKNVTVTLILSSNAIVSNGSSFGADAVKTTLSGMMWPSMTFLSIISGRGCGWKMNEIFNKFLNNSVGSFSGQRKSVPYQTHSYSNGCVHEEKTAIIPIYHWDAESKWFEGEWPNRQVWTTN